MFALNLFSFDIFVVQTTMQLTQKNDKVIKVGEKKMQLIYREFGH